MKAFVIAGLGAGVLLSGCSVPRTTASPPTLAQESLTKEWSPAVLPPLAGVRVKIGSTWLDLLDPPTIEQAAMQAGGSAQSQLYEARAVIVTRAEGRKVLIRAGAYGSFRLRDGDTITSLGRTSP